MIQLLLKEPANPKQKKTRRVSTLTPKQLARKRANDREAQRAIRIHTKEYIERLERELAELKSNQGLCNSNLSTGSDAIPSPAPFSRDYNSLHDYNQQYIPLSNNCEPLVSTISCTIPSNISTPLSPGGYSAGHIQTSMPNSVLPFNNTSSSSIYTIYNKDVVKIEYIEVGHHGTIPQTLHQSDMRYGE
ncbi:hypothetical protein BKA59DRAFT_495917 [Fusarium tricinctum]|uniref:BZIP domain-containing protein n=1 Tax=Fusarium tricinctum TaxID=61284 RepID=A0A8K0W6X0_9HYPO|nr:hypothetical protein BKA59DRAFT_495917 [Fusarium tricinctum]